MDRSFLSDARVVAESRNFVCIRLATYEDEQEAEFLQSVYRGRSGQMENTTFAILSPDGKKQLATSGRGPFHAYRNSDQMAMGMKGIAAQHPGANKAALADPQLPIMKDVELALNVAACDNLPVIITVADHAARIKELHQALLPLAWSEALAGQFVFASVTDKKLLKPITGVEVEEGILVVAPDQFGLSAAVVNQFADPGAGDLKAALQQIVSTFPRASKSHNNHVRLGIQLGIDWESEIPETDQQSLRAKERARGKR